MNEEENKHNEIDALGEFGLIDSLTKDVVLKNPSSLLGVGDDAAEIEISSKESILLSTDMLVEGVHFNLSYVPLKSLGFKAVSVNVSDILAMNGKPEQLTVSIGVSSKFPIEAIEELYKGIHSACEFYNVDLVGGDTVSSLSGLILSLSIVGRAAKEKICYRSGAKENDLIVVTGDLGTSYLGLQILEREKGVFLENPNIQPKLDGYDELVKKQIQPIARQDVIDIFQELDFVPSSMIDISDGLASELLHIAKSSDCSVSIYSDKLPITEKVILTADELSLDPYMCAMNGGEDYELLFTASQKDYEKIKNHPSFSIIGFVTDKSQDNLLIDKNNSAVRISAQGWKHFN
jgi:thiamine-monophosphate kinase